MKIKKISSHYKVIFILLIFLFLLIFFFSTGKVRAKAFEITDVEISKPFEMGFDKNKVIDEGFQNAFKKLIFLVVNSSDQKKIINMKLNEIKFMIESFSIKEEKFINEIYYLNLGVSFNRKKIFKYLENKNIFPSIPNKKKLLYLPIIIEEDKKNLFIFKNKNKIRILSRISIKNDVYLKNRSFAGLDLSNSNHIEKVIKDLKTDFEDYWKNINKINTSIRLPLRIKVKSSNEKQIEIFENVLEETDLIYDFFINKFDNQYIIYEIIYNGTPDVFLKSMNQKKLNFNIREKDWVLK